MNMKTDIIRQIEGWLDERNISGALPLLSTFGEAEPLVIEPENPEYCFDIDYGATKLVFTNLSTKKVYKIGFTHIVYSNFDDVEDFLEKKKEVFNDFLNNRAELDYERMQPYCRIEKSNYEDSKIFGYDKIFAETRYFATINGLPVYEQEKVCPFYVLFESPKTNSEIRKKRLRKIADKTRWQKLQLEDDYSIVVFLDYYGQDFIKKIDNFCNDWDINDITTSNVGFSLQKDKPVFFDYAGFDYEY